MKSILFITCFAVTLLGPVNCQQSEQETNAIRDHFGEKCRRYSKTAVSPEDLTNQFGQFTSYLQYASNVLFADPRAFCEEQKPAVFGAFRDLVFFLYKCLPPNEQYLKDFLITSWKEFLEFLCQRNGRNIEIFSNNEGRQCRGALEQSNGRTEVSNCLNKIFPAFGGELKKNDLCDDINVAKKCFSTMLTWVCPNNSVFQTLNQNLFTALAKPCTKGGTEHFPLPKEAKQSSNSRATVATYSVILVTSLIGLIGGNWFV